MTRLQEALQSLDLDAEVALSGQWARLRGKHCRVHIVEVGWGIFYNTWCEEPGDSSVRVYCDPITAIDSALRRASMPIELAFGTPGSWEAAQDRRFGRHVISVNTQNYISP